MRVDTTAVRDYIRDVEWRVPVERIVRTTAPSRVMRACHPTHDPGPDYAAEVVRGSELGRGRIGTRTNLPGKVTKPKKAMRPIATFGWPADWPGSVFRAT